jgi:hypothetical protein
MKQILTEEFDTMNWKRSLYNFCYFYNIHKQNKRIYNGEYENIDNNLVNYNTYKTVKTEMSMDTGWIISNI